MKWHVDKRIPLTFLFTLFLQMVIAIIWATHLDARVNVLEQQTAGVAGFNEKFGRIEERLHAVKQDVESIKNSVAQRRII